MRGQVFLFLIIGFILSFVMIGYEAFFVSNVYSGLVTSYSVSCDFLFCNHVLQFAGNERAAWIFNDTLNPVYVNATNCKVSTKGWIRLLSINCTLT